MLFNHLLIMIHIKDLIDIVGKENLLLDEKNFDEGEVRTFTLSEILQLLIDKKRKVSATTNNTQSSRSHVLVTIKFTIGDKNVFLYIGDFAGVENKFDYTFKYPDRFKDKINQIFSNMEYLRTHYSNKVELINQILDAEDEQVKLLTNTRNINSLLEIVFKEKLISDTIWNFSVLQHADEKFVEVYNKVYFEDKVQLKDEQIEKFLDDGHNYFYQTNSDYSKNDDYISKLVEMTKMIEFLDSKSGYNEGGIYKRDF